MPSILSTLEFLFAANGPNRILAMIAQACDQRDWDAAAKQTVFLMGKPDLDLGQLYFSVSNQIEKNGTREQFTDFQKNVVLHAHEKDRSKDAIHKITEPTHKEGHDDEVIETVISIASNDQYDAQVSQEVHEIAINAWLDKIDGRDDEMALIYDAGKRVKSERFKAEIQKIYDVNIRLRKAPMTPQAVIYEAIEAGKAGFIARDSSQALWDAALVELPQAKDRVAAARNVLQGGNAHFLREHAARALVLEIDATSEEAAVQLAKDSLEVLGNQYDDNAIRSLAEIVKREGQKIARTEKRLAAASLMMHPLIASATDDQHLDFVYSEIKLGLQKPDARIRKAAELTTQSGSHQQTRFLARVLEEELPTMPSPLKQLDAIEYCFEKIREKAYYSLKFTKAVAKLWPEALRQISDFEEQERRIEKLAGEEGIEGLGNMMLLRNIVEMERERVAAKSSLPAELGLDALVAKLG